MSKAAAPFDLEVLRRPSLVRSLIWMAALLGLIALITAGGVLTYFFLHSTLNRIDASLAERIDDLYAGATVEQGEVIAPALTDQEALRVYSGHYWEIAEPDGKGGLRLLVPSRRRYTRVEVSELTGVSVDMLERFWRALGFPGVDDDDRAFTDLDLEAVRLFQGLQALGAADAETAVQMARVIGSSMARIAEAELVPGDMVSAEVDPVYSAEAFAGIADVTIPAMAKLLEFVWRRQVAAGIQRSMMLRSHGLAPGQSPVIAVGFADMVGFTLLSQHLSDEELAAVVRRFEEISHDIVTSAGGRVVKMIGDEVMFVVDSVAAAARIGLSLADAYADDDLLSDVRVGLACGPVLVRDGDYFGPTVNLAHRIVNIGNPGTVLVSDDFHTAMVAEAPDEFTMLTAGLYRGHARFKAGIFAAWYPIKRLAAVREFHTNLAFSGLRDIIALELYLRTPTDAGRLNGCGLVVINPPYRFEDCATAIANAVLSGLGHGEPGEGTALIRLADE